MSAAYQQIEQQEAALSSAREEFFALQQYMGSESSMRLTHTQLQAYVVERKREIARDVVQGHLDLRAIAEQPVRGAWRWLRYQLLDEARRIVDVVPAETFGELPAPRRVGTRV